jgi:hypothetical protein
MRRAERGQTIPESVFFLPIVLLALFGIIYVSQFWVVAERTQLAVRYGNPANNPAGLYNVANIYAAATNPTGANCTVPPVAVLWDGAPLPGPTSAPYWLPATWDPHCDPTFSKNQGAQFLALYVASSKITMNTTVIAPTFLQNFAGLDASGTQMSAIAVFARPADPASIMCHSKEVSTRVNAALNAPSPNPTASPVVSPSPLPFGNYC